MEQQVGYSAGSQDSSPALSTLLLCNRDQFSPDFQY